MPREKLFIAGTIQRECRGANEYHQAIGRIGGLSCGGFPLDSVHDTDVERSGKCHSTIH
jgi:hypothetical protein